MAEGTAAIDHLVSEAIHVIREVSAEVDRPVLLFSGGKDSISMLRVAELAFAPAAIPFPLLQVDTGFDFPEVLAARDRWVERLGLELIVASVEDAIREGFVSLEAGLSRNRLQTPVLLRALASGGFGAAFGGGRRDEDRARAKERVVSHRDEFGQWDPRRQRPELWSLYNTRVRPGEHVRVFPLSNWTEVDVWTFLARDHIDLPSLYFAHEREVVERAGMLFAVGGPNVLGPGEVSRVERVRFRTVGDMSLTGCVRSSATTHEEVLAEVARARITERGATRADDRFSEAGMEDRKREGYF